jgi:Sulfotransferase domain
MVESVFQPEKVFCIGLSRTGTTSLEQALKELGYQLGDQHQGELLLGQYVARNFRPIIEFCLTADAFQDAPFSFPVTFLALDQSFPNAKFILSVRDNAEQWYDSLVRYHSNLFGAGRLPTREDLIRSTYSYPGFVWESIKALLNISEEEEHIYAKPRLVSYYNRHNSNVRDYFGTKTNLLEINVSDKAAYGKLCEFLGKKPFAEGFPWLNASAR